jgi:hypothetical protein
LLALGQEIFDDDWLFLDLGAWKVLYYLASIDWQHKKEWDYKVDLLTKKNSQCILTVADYY